MLVSLRELKKYVDIDGLSPEDIAKGLTFAGVEVEDITTLASGTNLVIGHVLDCKNHPDSDHLHVLNVDLGSKYGVKQIVCGAPNARKGINVIVSRVGAVLPKGEIKLSVIRGVESNGMCCSLLELGVESKYLTENQINGIEELPDDAPVGEENVLGYLGLDDTILNLKVLANRPDLLSLYNVAKEVGAIFSRKVNIPSYSYKEDYKTDLVVKSDTTLCTQFAGCEIKGIKIKPSPKWMQDFLMSEGVRSINNIVDIGNYVMLLTGQPLHMYDADKLDKNELIVKSDYNGDFVALDEKHYDIKENDIVITCNNKVMCLGGVMGSLACAVDENSKRIIIESASFDGASIRRTSNRLGLASESSSRFVKGTNHTQYSEVIAFTVKLIKELCDAKESSNIVNYIQEDIKDNVIDTSLEKINGRLGTNFSLNQICDVLNRLSFGVSSNGNLLKVKVPSFRLDVTCDADISEEVIRVLGFDNVKEELPTLETTIGGLTDEHQRLSVLRKTLCDLGLYECLTYSLLTKDEAKLFNLLNNEEHYSVLNPLTDEHEVLRTHLAHSLLKTSGYNVSRQAKSIALFECADLISKKSRSIHLGIVLTGEKQNQGIIGSTQYDFFDMKGIVETIFELFGFEQSRYKFDVCKLSGNELHPGKSADIYFQGQLIGRMGELHPDQYSKYDLGKNNTIVLEMNISPILNAKVSLVKASEISKYPLVNHDLALIVDEKVAVGDILRTIKVAGKGIVSDAQVFDVYVGEHVNVGKKSVAIRITYNSMDHTLIDSEISNTEDHIKFELSKAYNAELRG